MKETGNFMTGGNVREICRDARIKMRRGWVVMGDSLARREIENEGVAGEWACVDSEGLVGTMHGARCCVAALTRQQAYFLKSDHFWGRELRRPSCRTCGGGVDAGAGDAGEAVREGRRALSCRAWPLAAGPVTC